MCFSPTDESVTTIEDLTTCTQYSLEIGAGPVTRGQLPDDTGDNEEDETRQENLRFGEDSFKTFASTSPVSKIGLTETLYDNLFTLKIACRKRKKVISLLQDKQNLCTNM